MTIANAIAWGGSDAMLSMFIVCDAASAPPLALSLKPSSDAVRTFVLEDDGRVLGERAVFEYDFVFRELPPHLEVILRQCLEAARAAGARVAWFGFEGSFSFDFLLTKETANQVYAVADSRGVAIATDDSLLSMEWEDRVVSAGLEARAGEP